MRPLVKPVAIGKCHDRLRKAQLALQRCQSAQDQTSFASAWADLLMQAGSILNILEGSSAKTPQGRQWYGELRRDCKKDPLINYMYQARNAEEHEDDSTTASGPSRLTIGDPGQGLYIHEMHIGPNGVTGQFSGLEENIMPTVRFTPNGPQLKTIYDSRYKTIFEPPTVHGGLPLHTQNPIHVAHLYLVWLEALLSDISP